MNIVETINSGFSLVYLFFDLVTILTDISNKIIRILGPKLGPLDKVGDFHFGYEF